MPRQLNFPEAVKEVVAELGLDCELPPWHACEAARAQLGLGAAPRKTPLGRSLAQVIEKMGLDIALPRLGGGGGGAGAAGKKAVAGGAEEDEVAKAVAALAAVRRNKLLEQGCRLARKTYSFEAVATAQATALVATETETLVVPVDPERSFGAPLGQVLKALGGAKIALVSTPEFGPGPGAGEFRVPVMDALERAAGHAFPALVAGYDFKGSSSARDCGERAPDRDMTKADWKDSAKIEGTQWCRYWSGCWAR